MSTSNRQQIASNRYIAIRPLLGKHSKTRADAEKRAKEVGVSVGTIYRWISQYKSRGHAGLVPSFDKSGGGGKSRLPNETERAIKDFIDKELSNCKDRTTKEYYKEFIQSTPNSATRVSYKTFLRRLKIQYSPHENSHDHTPETLNSILGIGDRVRIVRDDGTLFDKRGNVMKVDVTYKVLVHGMGVKVLKPIDLVKIPE